jgi:hypothetical protein
MSVRALDDMSAPVHAGVLQAGSLRKEHMLIAALFGRAQPEALTITTERRQPLVLADGLLVLASHTVTNLSALRCHQHIRVHWETSIMPALLRLCNCAQ